MAQFEFDQWLEFFLSNFELLFEWDHGNQSKSFLKHGIYKEQAEEAFFDGNLLTLGKQISPQTSEKRFGILGKMENGKILFVNFTVRNLKIRIISSRKANNKEIHFYEKRKTIR